MRRTLLFIFSILSISCFSQSNNSFYIGKIIDSIEVVKNAHIINIKTSKGTFSNDNGIFKIEVQKNDSLKISCIGYKTKTIEVGNNFQEENNTIFLEKETYTLDEVVIRKHYLTGSLSLDIKKAPIDKKVALVNKIVSDIKKMDYYKIATRPIGSDEIHLAKPAPVTLPNTLVGIGIKSSSSSANKGKSLSQILEEKQEVHNKILKLLGQNFFLKELKIPKEKYLHFLTFCSYKGIEELYNKNNILELIKILRQESVIYLKL